MSLTTEVSVKENRVSTKTKDCFQLQTGIIPGMLHVGLWLATMITRNSTNQTRNLKQLTIKKNIIGKKCNSEPLREHISEMHQSQLLNSSQEQRTRMLSESRFGLLRHSIKLLSQQRIICFYPGCYQQNCCWKKERFCFPVQDTYKNEEWVNERDFLK